MGSHELLQNCHDLEKMDLEECILVSAPLTALQGALQPQTGVTGGAGTLWSGASLAQHGCQGDAYTLGCSQSSELSSR